MDSVNRKLEFRFCFFRFGFRLTESITIGPAAGRIIRSLNMPFRPVIFADGQYAIFDDMAGFKVLVTYQ